MDQEQEQDAKSLRATSLRPAENSCGLGSPALNEAGSSTPAPNSPRPLTPTKQPTPGKVAEGDDAAPVTARVSKDAAPKRKRLTAEEKETKEKEMAEKKKEREELAAKKAAEKAKQEEEKAARAKEREEQAAKKAVERAKQEEEKAARAKEREEQAAKKAVEKAKQEEEKAARAKERDEKRRKKEEEQRRLQEEKDKKARSQPKLNAFFTTPVAPKKNDGDDGTETGSLPNINSPSMAGNPAATHYDKLFKPFFVRHNTRLAPPSTQMDEQTKNAKSQILDTLIAGQTRGSDVQKQPFDPVELLCLASKPPRRGRIHHPVKHIMETAYREAESSSGTGRVAGHMYGEARQKLAGIPQKIIAFSRDVRPPYYGTVTLQPYILGRRTMSKLARLPIGRQLPLDYDNDSEAEWQEDEGEDVDMEDDEEELDDEDDMDGFLDDSDDAGLSRRVFGSTLEPESTGICFENHHRLGPSSTMYEHKMEFICGKRIMQDPGWRAKTAQAANGEAAEMAPPPAPANAFAALDGEVANSATSAKLVKAELLNDVKQAILDNRALSKAGIIDFIFHQFRNKASRAEVKNTLELVAEKKGSGRIKEWDLKPGHEIEW
ncbi:hypothetical protein UVI_02011960 [Ustilaginoidea virens]|uniref:Chromatin assembly factor 1 subunit A n=1 Tax=Ustilaginoidea virens TaxID=1159556 RepID=A0A1B5L310_USTVR|nr:hypothetical protein UVI_02011960 [Ustilaginoidea virens]